MAVTKSFKLSYLIRYILTNKKETNNNELLLIGIKLLIKHQSKSYITTKLLNLNLVYSKL
jgi:hypothetical protein